MSNNIKHTCAYQVSFFLNSEYSQQFNLDYKDVAILRTIADFMDMSDDHVCFANQNKISKISRVPKRTLIDRMKKYIELKLINKIRKRYTNHYYLGELIISDVQQWHLRSAATAHLKCGSRTLYNINYKNKYNESYPQAKKWNGLAPTAEKASNLLENYERTKNAKNSI